MFALAGSDRAGVVARQGDPAVEFVVRGKVEAIRLCAAGPTEVGVLVEVVGRPPSLTRMPPTLLDR